MRSYHVILLVGYLVLLQPYCCGLWFLSAVKLNLTSSVLDKGSPRETHSEDSNDPRGRKCSSLSGLTQLGDASDKTLFNTSCGIRGGRWAVCDLQCSDRRGWPNPCVAEESSRDSQLCRRYSQWPAENSQGAISLPTLRAFHSPHDHYGRDRAVCYRDNFHPTLVLAFLPPLVKEFSTCCSCPESRHFPIKHCPPAEVRVMKGVLRMGFPIR